MMKLKLGALVSVFCLCFSSYSLAYDQQYQVGGTGPNGGIVTTVEVTSVLTDQTTKQVGDFEEKTYTYTWTEKVTEDVTSTQQITTTTYETVEKSTGDIINNTNLSSGAVTCTSSGSGIYLDNCATHTINWDDMHGGQGTGQYQYQTNLNEWMTKDEWQYGFSATGDVSAKSDTNSAYLTITLKVLDPTTGADQQSSTQWLLSSSYNTYSKTLDVTSNTFSDSSYLLATFQHSDLYGYSYTGDYQNFNLGITYNELTAVISTIEQTIINSIQSSLDTIESEITQTYNPIIQPGTDTTTTTDLVKIEEPKAIEIKMETNSGTTMTFDVKVETTPTGTVNVSMADSTGKVEQIAEIKPMEVASAPEPKVELKMETKSESTSSSTTKTETKTETTTTKTETKQESSKEEKKEDSKDSKKEDSKDEKENKTTTVAEAKQKVATKILQQILSTTDAILINDTKLGLMIALADTENFAKYQAKQNQDLAQWYLSEGIYQDQKMLEDPYSVLYNLANDKLHDELTDLQYNYKYQ